MILRRCSTVYRIWQLTRRRRNIDQYYATISKQATRYGLLPSVAEERKQMLGAIDQEIAMHDKLPAGQNRRQLPAD